MRWLTDWLAEARGESEHHQTNLLGLILVVCGLGIFPGYFLEYSIKSKIYCLFRPFLLFSGLQACQPKRVK